MKLFSKIVLILVAVFTLLGGMQLALMFVTVRDLMAEVEQRLYRHVPLELAARMKPLLEPEPDFNAIVTQFHQVMLVNPRFEMYLVSNTGEIILYFGDPRRMQRNQIDVAPLETFLAGGKGAAILGDDPRSLSGRKAFSAAPVKIGNEPGYLYVILGGERYESILALTGESTIIATAAIFTLGMFIAAAAGGVFLLFLVTRRLLRMQRVVESYRRGKLDARCEADGKDEIGSLGRAFNEMANTISENMRQLEQSDLKRREFIANVSHDLRSPLASIHGYVETLMIKGETVTPAQRKEFLEISIQTVDRMRNLVDDLFQLAKFDSAARELRREPFSLEDLIHDVVMKLAPLAEQRAVRLRMAAQSSLPLVLGDIALIERALSNLIDNAIRYAGWGGQVETSVVVRQNEVEVTIADNGPGIAPEERERVFERFYRVDKSRSQETGGGGLGLAIVQEIVRAHGQAVKLESASGAGARFSFSLPLATGADAAPVY